MRSTFLGSVDMIAVCSHPISIAKMPKALLQLHSETFSSMLEVSESDGKPIELQDDSQAFRDWSTILLR